MSQDRMDSPGVSPSRPATSYQSPDIGDTLNRVSNTMKKCRVVHGANEGYFEIEGKNVGQVRKSLRDVFSIPSDAVALIDGKTVNDDFIMEAGQQLEFNKETGTKGVRPAPKPRPSPTPSRPLIRDPRSNGGRNG